MIKMEYHDFESQTKVGDIVFICDYRYNDLDNKAIRHVMPQKVMVVSNDDLPKNKRVHYSDFHFRPLGKSGQPTKTIIAPYDNTGYRHYTGISLNVFYAEKDCIEFYNQQCQGIIEDYEKAKERKVKYYDQQIQQVRHESLEARGKMR